MFDGQQEPIAIVFLGSIGVGKSYFSRRLSEKSGVIRINADAFRLATFGSLEEIHKHDGHGYEANKRLFRGMEYMVRQIVSAGHSVIIDTAKYNNKEFRNRLKRLIHDAGGKLVVVWIETPRETASLRVQARDESEDQRRLDAQRAEEILDDHYSKFQPPASDEHVIKIDGVIDFTLQYQSFSEQLQQYLKDNNE